MYQADNLYQMTTLGGCPLSQSCPLTLSLLPYFAYICRGAFVWF